MSCFLRSARHRCGKSKRYIADEIGVTESTIDNWETEETMFAAEKTEKIAQAYDIPIQEVVEYRAKWTITKKGYAEVRRSLRKASLVQGPPIFRRKS